MAAAPDAVVIDTGSRGIEEMVQMALAVCAAAGLGTPGRSR
jgi:cytidylate kinase